MQLLGRAAEPGATTCGAAGRRLGLPRLALSLLLALPVAVSAQERIERFETEVYLGTHDDFEVVEKIAYDFGPESRHGIYRDIPVAYGRGRAADYRVRLEVEAVTDAEGRARPYRAARSGRFLRIRIGDPDRAVRGRQDYWIRYRVERGYLYFEDHDELYWNATGNAWSVPIATASAVVYLPGELSSDGLQHECFTGPFGSMERRCSVSATPQALWFRTERPLRAQEGLTVVVGLPKGVLVEPSRLSRLLSRLGDYLTAWALLPLFAAGGMTWLWQKQGRDPGGGAAIPVRYEPPEGLSPAEVGTVLDEKVDLIDITSTLLDLAVRGYLRIEEVETDGFLFLKQRDYRLVKLREPDQDLRLHESVLFNRLFGSRESVLVSSLKNDFYRHLPEIERILYDEVSRKGRYFPTSPRKVRRLWAGAGVALLGAAGIALGMQLSVTAVLPLALSGVILLVFARIMPRRTRRGRRVYEQILGFKEFAERVDRDRLERLGRLEASLFERALPYAIVLGVADAWADAFADLYREPPAWYVGAHPGAGFRPRVFVGDLGQSLDTIGQALRSSPRQGGSGASGLGGGGFSGGGFGGGGGGSW